ncbi:hypothetical protein CDL15_Pgr015080 [Punica granatum]|uniref:Uncharacterized protein n=1 Tax=Punica granatum TaxID=22663 RepID=A0A218X1B8_PUNGR|nr:hypothetical protein CDL15_Pgr015080 [Punica granatum]
MDDDQRSDCPIKVHTLQLSENAIFPDSNMSTAPFTDTSTLQEPFRELLLERKPNCIVVDMFHRWSVSASNCLSFSVASFESACVCPSPSLAPSLPLFVCLSVPLHRSSSQFALLTL